MGKNILICGSSGFIGKNCLDYFANNDDYQITATFFNEKIIPINENVKNGIRYVNVDLRNETEVQALIHNNGYFYDIIIQAAATTTGSKDVIEKPYLHVTDNAVMNSWIFREAVLNNVGHVIFPSCTVMYQSKDQPQKESDWSEGDEIFDSYFGVGKTKVYLENMCNFYSKLGKTKFTAIRHSNVYGQYDKFDLDKCHVVPAFINKIINSTDILDVWGDGSAKRDILYIDDLVDMIDKVIKNQKTKYELYNCGAGKAFSIKELADAIMKVNDKKLTIKYDSSKPNIPTVVILDCDKAKNELGWTAKTTIEKGIKLTSDWYKKNYL